MADQKDAERYFAERFEAVKANHRPGMIAFHEKIAKAAASVGNAKMAAEAKAITDRLRNAGR